MANYCCTIRTNYFHVKDADDFRSFMKRVYGSEDGVELWEEKDKDGNVVFGFGCYGGISGLKNAIDDEEEDCDESSYDEFLSGLQTLIADDDAIVILEAGNEKMRYVIGSATVITHKGCEYFSIDRVAKDHVREILGNKDWDTTCEY